MDDLISRQAAIEVIAYSIELCNKALDSMTLGGRDRYAVEVERNSLLKLKDDFKLLPSAQPEIIRCKDCKFYSPMNRETKTGICNLTMHQNFGDNWFCAGAERRTNGSNR